MTSELVARLGVDSRFAFGVGGGPAGVGPGGPGS